MPPNEPQWGKKNNEGPPDLDEILRKLQQKIASLLGFRSRGPGRHHDFDSHSGFAAVLTMNSQKHRVANS